MTLISQLTIARSEAIQRLSWSKVSNAAPTSLRATFGIRVEVSGSTLYQAASAIPGAQFNKVLSFGLDGDVSSEALRSARDWLSVRCSEGSLIMVPPNERIPELDHIILSDGFRRYPLDMMTFLMNADAAPDSEETSGVDVRPVSQ